MAVADELDLMEEFLLASPGFDYPDFLPPESPAPFSPLFDVGSCITTAAAPPSPAPAPAATSTWLLPPQAHVKERLQRALQGIAQRWQAQRGCGGELLVQAWVPTRIGDRQMLTTCGQPFWLDRPSGRLESYRGVSVKYQFSADELARDALGLPGRVFVGRVPEWTPDVRYFTDQEYPRVRHAQYFDIRGSVAMPVFERRTGACLGVVELVMTTQKINYNAEIENICNALQVHTQFHRVPVAAPFDSPKSYTCVPRICCYALNLFDQMPLGKDVIDNYRARQSPK
jgi:hypothetical protein